MIDVEDKETKKQKKVPTMKLYWVFNLEQTTINGSPLPESEIVKSHTADQIWENFLDKPEVIQHPQPHYNPLVDRIGIPHLKDFNAEVEYRLTLFHEAVHSTGSSKRL